MEIEVASTFGKIDYCVFAGTLLISLLIGIYTSLKGNKSPEEFLMGNRSFGPVPIAMSILTSLVSAISLLGYSGEAYAHGAQMSLFVAGIGLGIVAASLAILPVIYPLKLTSINEYIELRFKSSRLMSCISFLTCTQGLFYMGMCLYAPTIAMVSVTNLDYITYVFLLGIICTLYSSFGGIRAVIWTDVFQLSVILIGLLVVDIIGCHKLGGLKKTWSIASSGGRLDLFNMNPSPFERHTFFNTIAMGFFGYACAYGTSQMNVQRMCSVRSIGDAYKILLINFFGMFFIYFLIFTGGVITYATYAGCDPLIQGLIRRKEEIMPHFIVDRLSFVPGLSGMFVATLIGGTMSSLSSVVNSTVAMLWRDICLKFQFFKHSTTKIATLTNKVLSLFVGCLLIGIALIAAQAGSVVELSITIAGVVVGPVFGVFLIGLLLPKCNIKGVWSGLITSLIFVSWIAIGSFYLKEKPKMLPLSIESCSDIETLIRNSTVDSLINSFTNAENASQQLKRSPEADDFPLAKLYGISYTLYIMIGPVACVAIAVVVSFITGGQNIDEVSPKYVTPFLRKFYWSEDELKSLQMNEQQRIVNYGVTDYSKDENDFEKFVKNEKQEIIV